MVERKLSKVILGSGGRIGGPPSAPFLRDTGQSGWRRSCGAGGNEFFGQQLGADLEPHLDRCQDRTA